MLHKRHGNPFTEGSRVVILGDPGKGYSDDPYKQIRTDIFAPPQVGSLGLESGRNYLNRAPLNNLDLSVQKSFPVMGSRRAVRFRVDAFNALNHTQFIGPNNQIMTVNFASLTDPTITNLPHDSQGNLVRRDGFGAITNVAQPRTLQLVTRITF